MARAIHALISSFRNDKVVDRILEAARTNERCDDGTILVTEIAEAISVRTGKRVLSTIT